MKKIAFTHRGVGHTLFTRSGKSNAAFYFQFRDTTGRRPSRCLDTGDEREARKRAKMILDAVADGKWEQADNLVRGRKRVSRKNPELTFGKAAQLLRAKATWVRARTRRDYASSLLNLGRAVLGLSESAVLTVPVSRLTKAAIDRWRCGYVGAETLELTYPYERSVGCNSTLRQARAGFSKRACDTFGWERPEFMDVQYLREPDSAYVPIPVPQLKAMEAALPALRETDEAMWAVNGLIRLCGLRASEVMRAKREWLRDGVLHVSAVAGEAAPKRRSGGVRVAPGPLLDYLEARPAGSHLIPANTGTDRYDLIYREHSAWVRRFVPGRTKSNHELRKHAGSLIAKKTNSFEKAAAFLRIDIETAKGHYLALLDTSDIVLDEGDWVS